MSTQARTPGLAALRSRLGACDRALVRLVGERMALVADVAALKARSGAPPFDREREGAHLARLEQEGAAQGVPPDLVRHLFTRLFSASRRAQRVLRLAKAERSSIGVIGGTAGMGAFLARVFRDGGFEVEVTGLDGGAPAVEVASRHDLVVVAVPIAATPAVIGEIGPHVRSGAVLMDVTSLKRGPLDAMLAAAPPDVGVVGTHPMFGPSGDDFDRQKVVLCRGRDDAAFERVRRLWELFGAETLECDAAEHDAQMALIQVLVHLKTLTLGSTLERAGADLDAGLRLASPIYRAELAMVGRMFSQGAELYADILTANPHGERLAGLFVREAEALGRAVADRDRMAIITRFRSVGAFMRGFVGWARRQSDAILHDLVQSG